MYRTISGLKEYILMLIEYEEKALAADHPDSKCASNHRGFIRALKLVYNNIVPISEQFKDAGLQL